MKISLIVPAFNEEQFLPALLDSIDAARDHERVEVIVADNASTDRTAEIARARGCRVVRVEPRTIAAVRNGGARAATNEVLAFVDADCRIHPDTFGEIERVLDDKAIVGATGIRFSRMSPGIAVTVALVLPQIRLLGLDGGVIFCRRKDWEAVGGYDAKQLVSEDVRFLLALKRLGRTRGQRFVRARGVPTIVSTRKFDRHGDWHFLAGMLWAPLLYLTSRQRFERWARRYWYED